MPWAWVSAAGLLFSRVALLDERHVDGLARDGVNRFRQRGDRHAFRFVGGRDDHGQHLTQRINRHVDRAPRAVLLPVIASTRAAFRGRWYRTRGNDHRARRGYVPCDGTYPRAPIMDELRTNLGLQTAIDVLRDGGAWRQIGGDYVRWSDGALHRRFSRADDPAPSAYDLAQRVVALWGVFGLPVREGATTAPSLSLPSRR